jgi:hypothetical protein
VAPVAVAVAVAVVVVVVVVGSNRRLSSVRGP